MNAPLPFAARGAGLAGPRFARPAPAAIVIELPRQGRTAPCDWPEPEPADRDRVVQLRYTEAAGPDPDAHARGLRDGRPRACASQCLYGPSPLRALAAVVRRLDVPPAALVVWALAAAPGDKPLLAIGRKAEGLTLDPVPLALAEGDLTLEEARPALARLALELS